MLNRGIERQKRLQEDNPIYQKLLDELNEATTQMFHLSDQLTAEQNEVLNRYLVAFCRVERYQNLLDIRRMQK